MKWFFALAALLGLSAWGLADHHHGGGNGHHNSGHHGGHQGHKMGKNWKGKSYKHFCYKKGWTGWKYQRWYKPMGCWLYWSAIDVCWYQYVDTVFVPCDTLVTVDAVPE